MVSIYEDGVFKLGELTPILVRANACVNATLVLLVAFSVLRALLFVIQADPTLGFALGSIFLGLGTSLMYTNNLAAICDHSDPSWRSSALGAYRFLRDMGYTVGTLVTGVIAAWVGIPSSSRRVRAQPSAPSKDCARLLASMRCSGARVVGGTRVAPALALLVLAAWVSVAAGLDACPAVGGAVVSPCAVARTCNVSVVRAGRSHTCALLSHGGVRCWGYNREGELGIGNTDNMGDAQYVSGPYTLGIRHLAEVASLADVDLGEGRTAVKIAAASYHTCAVLDDGHIKCWGGNDFGQLGLGDTRDRGRWANYMGVNLPSVDLGANWTIVEVAAGGGHTCARLENGAARALKCWGWNMLGQLGLGDTLTRGGEGGSMGDSLPAVQLGTGRSAVALALGTRHSCALLDDASVKCWGRNKNGDLGLGDSQNRGDGAGEMGEALPAVDLGAGRTVVQLAAGSHHTCALLDNGQLKCWGRNFRGQLGIGDMVDRGRGIRNDMGANLPSVDVGAGWTVVEVAAGATHTCTRLKNGAARALKCWGYNAAGQLDLGDTNYRGYVEEGMGDSLPAVQLGTGRSAVVLALGSYHSCALLDDASVKCWGRNREGQLGLGDVNNRGDGGGGMDDSLPAVPLCLGPCPAGYMAGFTGEDGEQCSACEVGTYKTAAGAGSCAVCPSHTSSLIGSNELTDCKCLPGYTVASDGVACSACTAGAFKHVVGTAACETCPANAESSSGSVLCQCSAGFTGADGWACVACEAGTYKATAGTAACETCPANAESSSGSALCQCLAGFTGAVGGQCSACSDCDSVVTFTATLAMSRAEFTADKQDAYVAGVAQALSVAPSRVAIASITDQSTRRRLLAASIAVSTTATVPKDKAAGVAAAATAENLNRTLASSGISVGAVSSSSGGLGTAGLAGIVAGVVVLLVAAGSGAYWWHRSRRAYQEQFADLELTAFSAPRAQETSAPGFNTATPGAPQWLKPA